MSFLQPFMLAALPLMALPILIHLINQHRHRSVRWGGMMFLVSANRMNKGMARLRYVLIMLLRILAVGAIIFAVSRPLVSGKLGRMGMAKPDATLILLDRSASMEAQELQSGESKRSTALQKLSELLEKRNYGSQLVLIDSARGEVQNIESPRSLLDLPVTKPTSTSADIPSMLEKGLAYLKANEAGRADIWICSDLKENDWNPDSGRWSAIREEFSQMKGVQHFLLSYAEQPYENLSIRVSNVKRRQSGNRSELVLDVQLHGEGRPSQGGNIARRVPVEFEINKVRSVIELELDSKGATLLGHRIPIDSKLTSGWGSVSLPGDSNPLDNRFYFVFSEPPVRKAVIVTDDDNTGEAFRLSLGIPTEPGLNHEAEVVSSAQTHEIDWENTSLLIWQIPFPDAPLSGKIEQFVGSGRVVMFFPPDQTNGGQLFGTRWGAWQKLDQEKQRRLSWWRGDADLLSHVGNGDPLPLKELRTFRYCSLVKGDEGSAGTPLAKLGDDQPLLTRAATDRGGVYFCNTLPTAGYSSFERDAIAFYVLLQRALTNGSRSLATAVQRDADAGVTGGLVEYESVAPTENAPTVSERGLHMGVYQDSNNWIAVNRSLAEDDFRTVPVSSVDELFNGLAYNRIDDEVGDTSSLASEIWRVLLYLMALALILEAVLCLPDKKVDQQPGGSFAPSGGKMTRESMA